MSYAVIAEKYRWLYKTWTTDDGGLDGLLLQVRMADGAWHAFISVPEGEPGARRELRVPLGHLAALVTGGSGATPQHARASRVDHLEQARRSGWGGEVATVLAEVIRTTARERARDVISSTSDEIIDGRTNEIPGEPRPIDRAVLEANLGRAPSPAELAAFANAFLAELQHSSGSPPDTAARP